jgi:hypothetical protein
VCRVPNRPSGIGWLPDGRGGRTLHCTTVPTSIAHLAAECPLGAVLVSRVDVAGAGSS